MYVAGSTAMTYFDARQWCINQGYEPATIFDATQNEFARVACGCAGHQGGYAPGMKQWQAYLRNATSGERDRGEMRKVKGREEDDGVARVDGREKRMHEALIGAWGDHELMTAHADTILSFHLLAQRLEQRCLAVARTILAVAQLRRRLREQRGGKGPMGKSGGEIGNARAEVTLDHTLNHRLAERGAAAGGQRDAPHSHKANETV